MSDRPAPHLSDEQLNEYLDGELAPLARAEAEAHLGGCAACAERLEALRALFAGLEALPDAELARDLAPAVVTALRPRTPQAVQAWRPWLAWALAAQALAALGAMAVAWPHVAERLGRLPALTLPWMALARELVAALQAAASAIPAPSEMIDRLIAAWPTAWSLAWPDAAAWVPVQAALAVAAGAGLLWLFTNLWLLGHQPSDHARRR